MLIGTNLLGYHFAQIGIFTEEFQNAPYDIRKPELYNIKEKSNWDIFNFFR